jgi:outer membrane protein OmpA-like peptidoglycan-associated protein
MKIEIAGHTDEIGPPEYNSDLSQQRANAVKKYLTSKGVSTDRVKAVGYGETKPMATNDDELEGRALNRRTEFIILNR